MFTSDLLKFSINVLCLIVDVWITIYVTVIVFCTFLFCPKIWIKRRFKSFKFFDWLKENSFKWVYLTNIVQWVLLKTLREVVQNTIQNVFYSWTTVQYVNCTVLVGKEARQQLVLEWHTLMISQEHKRNSLLTETASVVSNGPRGNGQWAVLGLSWESKRRRPRVSPPLQQGHYPKPQGYAFFRAVYLAH